MTHANAPGEPENPLEPDSTVTSETATTDVTVPGSTHPRKKSFARTFISHIGPGLITGAADDDPSGIGTYSVAGAQFGYGLLWLAPFCVPLMIVVQEMCGRIGAITGKGLASVLKERYPRWILWSAVLLLFGANVTNVWADLNVMAASMKMLFGQRFELWLTAITAATIGLQIAVPYRKYVKFLKWMSLALLAYVVTAFLPNVHINWAEVLPRLLTPHWSKDPAFAMTVVGFLGTTISPYLFFWQAGQTVEEEVADHVATSPGHRRYRATEAEIRMVRADTVLGMVASQIITVFIVLTTAATLHSHGVTQIDTAQQAAKALLPLGRSAYFLFTLGIIGTGLLAIPTLAGSAAYALSETLGWKYGLYRRFSRARAFYITIAAVILVGYLMNFIKVFSPIKGLLVTAVINGVAAPPLIVLLLFICNNRAIVGDRTNGPVRNGIGWLTVVLMTIAAAVMFWSMAHHRA